MVTDLISPAEGLYHDSGRLIERPLQWHYSVEASSKESTPDLEIPLLVVFWRADYVLNYVQGMGPAVHMLH